MIDLKNLVKDTPEMKEERKEIGQTLLNDPVLLAYLKKNKMDASFVLKYPMKFQGLLNTLKKCTQCDGTFCEGFQKVLVQEEGRIKSVYKACSYLQEQLNREKEEAMKRPYLRSYRVYPLNKDYIDADFSMAAMVKDKDYTPCVSQVIKANKADPSKGLYLYGKVGVGKTYLAACITNQLAKENKKIAFVHIPTYLSDLKNAFDSPEVYEYLVENVKKIEVLVLDDIGAESVSVWYRDEILLPLVNYRMNEGLLTYFTSNLSLKDLEEKMSITKNDVDEISAQRVCDRIRVLAKEIEIIGDNKRLVE